MHRQKIDKTHQKISTINDFVKTEIKAFACAQNYNTSKIEFQSNCCLCNVQFPSNHIT